jgi:succinate dehydrogenase / fumarate reductase cytochrome b subunit
MKRWFDLRRRSAGLWAFRLHRLSGIGLVFYLYLHLAVLNQLRGGPGRWDAFVALARSPLFLALDVILLGGVLIHGLNGLRLTLLGFGRGLRWQKQLFWVSLTLSVVLTGWGAVAMFRR